MERQVSCEGNKVNISLVLDPMEVTVLRHIEIVNPNKPAICEIVDSLEECNFIRDDGDQDYVQTDLGKQIIQSIDYGK